MNSQEFFDAMAGSLHLYRNIPDFNPDQWVEWLGPRIVQTSGQNYAIAMHKDDPTDCSDRTEYFDWHSDGLYHPKPPRFVLLHCLNPGAGLVNTELAAVSLVLDQISEDSLNTLYKSRSNYIGHGGCFNHPIIKDGGILLASRGYISPPPDLYLEGQPTIRDTADAMSELYCLLDDNAIAYEWSAGDTLVFDQYRYLHRRNSQIIDKDRKLVRMWFN